MASPAMPMNSPDQATAARAGQAMHASGIVPQVEVAPPPPQAVAPTVNAK
jgi:hypothetical protein